MTLKSKSEMDRTDNERAVSPVIGVILMVAITVILAAVIAAFVLDLGGSVSNEAQAGVSMEFDEDAEELSIQVTTLGNADYVTFGGVAEEFEESSSSTEFFSDANGNTDASAQLDLTDHQMVVGDTISLSDSVSELNSVSGTEGTVTAVAVIEEDGTKTQVGSIEIDIS